MNESVKTLTRHMTHCYIASFLALPMRRRRQTPSRLISSMNSLSNRRGGTSSLSDKSMEISSGSGLPLDPVNGNDNDNDDKECKAMRSGGMSATKLSKICRYALPIILFFTFGVLYYIPINEANLVSNYLVASVPTVLIDCKDCNKVCFMDEKVLIF